VRNTQRFPGDTTWRWISSSPHLSISQKKPEAVV
jgi:hypothetical protein